MNINSQCPFCKRGVPMGWQVNIGDDRFHKQCVEPPKPEPAQTPRGCICPPGAEATCRNIVCGRRGLP